jgi:hypothetical protein
VLLTTWPTFHDDLTLWRRRRGRSAAVANAVAPANGIGGMQKTIDHYAPGQSMFNPQTGRRR